MRQPSPHNSRPRDATLEAVKRRGRQLRRRRRLLVASTPLIAITAIASAAVAVKDDDVRVVTADDGTTTSTRPRVTTSTTDPLASAGPTTLVPPPGPPTTSSPGNTTTTEPGPGTTTTTAPRESAGVVATIELSSTVVVAGGTLTGELVIDNRGDGPVRLLEAGCRPKWAVHLAGPDGLGGRPVFPSDCDAEPLTFEPGLTRLPFTVRASHAACAEAPPPGSRLPRCLPPPDREPPLPVGRYEATLVTTSPSLVAAPVAVEVVTE